MDSHDILVELLAIKLFEHTPLGSGEPHRLSWTGADPEDRQYYRDMIVDAANSKDLYEQFKK